MNYYFPRVLTKHITLSPLPLRFAYHHCTTSMNLFHNNAS